MAAATYANAWTQAKLAIKLLNETEKFAASNSPNYADLWELVNAGADYDNAGIVTGVVAEHRDRLSAMLDPVAVQRIVGALLLDFADGISSPEKGTLVGMYFRMREYMLANNKTIKSRNFTYGSATGVGSPAGNGSLVVLTEDDSGYRLENCHSQILTLECVEDQQQVERHREVFEVRGAVAKRDWVERTGSGRVWSLQSLTTIDSEQYIHNPDFQQQSSGTAPTAGSETTCDSTTQITGWTLTTAANAKISVDYSYRSRPGFTGRAIRFTGNNKITQTISTAARARWPEWTPFVVQVAVNPRSNSTGTFTIRFGATVQNFTVGSLNNEQWNVCRLTLDKKLYHKQFTKDSMTFEIEYSSAGGGSNVYFASLICAPMTPIDGLFYAAIGGSTPWLRGDKYTFEHQENATRAINSYWIWRSRVGAEDERAFQFSLPSVTDASETEADPS